MAEPTPAPTPQPAAPKPIKTVKYLLWGAIAFVLFLSVAGVINSVRLSAPVARGEKPRVVDPRDLATYDTRNTDQLNDLLKHPQASDEAPPVTPLTKEQNNALGIQDSGAQAGKQDALHKREERELLRLAALRSTSVLVDFSNDDGEEAERASRPRVEEPRRRDDQPEARTEEVAGEKNPAIVDPKKELAPWDSYTGKLYRLFEGRDMIEAILMNRINGAAAGPLIAQVSLDIYSHNHQKLLIPQGTVVTGDVTAVNSTQQQRLFVSFHRMIMPDGFSVSLDKFTGLNQAGEVGLRDKVNHHYLSIFGASLAIGAIGGLTQIGNSTSGFGYNPGAEFRNGVSQRTGEEAMQVLNRYLNQLPTFTVRERSRLRIWLANDLLLPAADNHTMPGDI